MLPSQTLLGLKILTGFRFYSRTMDLPAGYSTE